MPKNKQIKKKRHYPPAYYRYREKHPTISVSLNKELKESIDKLKLRVFLFSLEPSYLKYFRSNLVSINLSNAFKNKNLSLSINTPIKKIGEKKWYIKDGTKEYIIRDIGKKLKVYEKMSYARFLKHILEDKTDHLIALKEEYNKGFNEGIGKWRIWYNCSVCNKKIQVTPNSLIHRFINGLMKNKGMGHKACLDSIKKANKHRTA